MCSKFILYHLLPHISLVLTTMFCSDLRNYGPWSDLNKAAFYCGVTNKVYEINDEKLRLKEQALTSSRISKPSAISNCSAGLWKFPESRKTFDIRLGVGDGGNMIACIFNNHDKWYNHISSLKSITFNPGAWRRRQYFVTGMLKM